MSGSPVPMASRTTEVRELARGEERRWDEFVQHSPYGTFFHLSAWKGIVEDILGHRSHFLVARDEKGIAGEKFGRGRGKLH